MRNETSLVKMPDAGELERVLVGGDLSKLTADERIQYYRMVCESVGLNPLTRPLEYITLNGKLTLYARKDATDQLRANNQVSITIAAREVVEGCYVVTARAQLPSGRTDESIGAVPIDSLKGEARSNALMKCETKAKRRVTLSICGMGLLDETEVDSISGARAGEPPALITEPKVFGKRPPAENQNVPLNPGYSHAAALAGNHTPAPPDESLPFEPLPPLEELVANVAKTKTMDTKKSDEFIDLTKQNWLRLEFQKLLPVKYQATAISDQLRRGWLKSEGFVNAKDEGTSTVIPEKQFKAVAAALLNFAKAQGK